MKRIGILTGGGDCPGLNAVIRGVCERCFCADVEVFGFYDGWRGVIEQDGQWLTENEMEGLQTMGGTILGSSRTNVMRIDDGPERVKQTMDKLGLEAIVAIGGDDTLGVARSLQKMGMNMVGVPKTIDNDLSGTDYPFGFDTACNNAMAALDNVKFTAMSHRRVIVVELMGRHTGWIAVHAGIAGNAQVIAIPEYPMHIDEICRILSERHRRTNWSVVAVAEAAEIEGIEQDESDIERDAFGNKAMDQRAIGERLARAINARTGIPARHVVLAHLQRGGNPSAYDRVLASRLGVGAANAVLKGNFGTMVSLRGTDIVLLPLEAALQERKCVPRDLYETAQMFMR